MKCAVITPIGPGHADLYRNECLASIEAAAAFSTGPFDEVIPFGMDDTAGEYGRSDRRNAAIQQALEEGIDWVFFLDADDIMAPNAFEAFGEIIASEPNLDAVWGLICNFDENGDPVLREGQVVSLSSHKEFLGVKPYFSIQIGAFMKTSCVAEFGFDVDMNAGEDFKLYYQMWERCRCAKKPVIFFVNRIGQHSSGPRSATGRDWAEIVQRLWEDQLSRYSGLASLPPAEQDGPSLLAPITDPSSPVQAVHTECEFFARKALESLRERFKDRPLRVLQVGTDRGNALLYLAAYTNLDQVILVDSDADADNAEMTAARLNGFDHLLDAGGIGAAWEDIPSLLYGLSVDVIMINQPGDELDVLKAISHEITDQTPLVWVEMAGRSVMPVMQHLKKAHGYAPCGSFKNVLTTSYLFQPIRLKDAVS